MEIDNAQFTNGSNFNSSELDKFFYLIEVNISKQPKKEQDIS